VLPGSQTKSLCANKRNANSTDNLIKCEEMTILEMSQINLESVVQSFLKRTNGRHYRYAHMLLTTKDKATTGMQILQDAIYTILNN
jgi:hypothetical protein